MSIEHLPQRHLVVAVLRGALFQLAKPLFGNHGRLRHISAEEITRVVAASQLPASPLPGNPRVLPAPLDRYLKKVVAAGGFTAYERAHRARLVAMLVPKLTHMPADAISHMVDFAFHVGFY